MIKTLSLLFFGIILLVYGNELTQSILQEPFDATTQPVVTTSNEIVEDSTSAIPPNNAPSQPEPETSIEEADASKMDTVQSKSDAKDETSELILFDFDGEDPSWYTVNDDVMGGISTSSVSVENDGDYLTFSGDLSLENNGGFASTRSDWSEYNLEDYDGIMLRVRGDGQVYRFRIRTEQTGSNISYTALFATEENKWQDVFIPFSEMVPLYFGYVVNDAGPLSSESIRSFGLMLSHKQEGEFLLEVDQISAMKR